MVTSLLNVNRGAVGPFKMRRHRFKNSRILLIGLAMMALIGLLVYILYASSSSSSTVNPKLQTEHKNPFTILYWTKVFNNGPLVSEPCLMKNPCTYSTDRNDFDKADAVVFHWYDIKDNDFPAKQSSVSTKKYVFYSQESTSTFKKLPEITSLINKYGLDFHWIWSYLRSADVKEPYGGFLVEPKIAKERGFRPIASFTKEQIFEDKVHKAALWFVSNCENQERLKVANALKKYFPVDIGGKCGNQTLCPRGTDCTPLMKQYYFYLAFENSNCKDYATEKFSNLYPLPIVPIVMKRSVYKDLVPPNSFIAVDDFPNAEKLAEHLNYLIANPDEYAKLLSWKSGWAVADWNSEGYRLGSCALCEKLQNEWNTQVKPVDVQKWYTENLQCSKLDPNWFN